MLNPSIARIGILLFSTPSTIRTSLCFAMHCASSVDRGAQRGVRVPLRRRPARAAAGAGRRAGSAQAERHLRARRRRRRRRPSRRRARSRSSPWSAMIPSIRSRRQPGPPGRQRDGPHFPALRSGDQTPRDRPGDHAESVGGGRLSNPDHQDPDFRETQAAGAKLGCASCPWRPAPGRGRRGPPDWSARAHRSADRGLVPLDDAPAGAHPRVRHRPATAAGHRLGRLGRPGALFTYGPNIEEIVRRSARQVDRILHAPARRTSRWSSRHASSSS